MIKVVNGGIEMEIYEQDKELWLGRGFTVVADIVEAPKPKRKTTKGE